MNANPQWRWAYAGRNSFKCVIGGMGNRSRNFQAEMRDDTVRRIYGDNLSERGERLNADGFQSRHARAVRHRPGTAAV